MHLVDYGERTEKEILEEQLDCLCDVNPGEKTYEEFIIDSAQKWAFATFDFCEEHVFDLRKLKTRLPCDVRPLYDEQRVVKFVATYCWVYKAQTAGVTIRRANGVFTMKEYFDARPHYKERAIREIFPKEVVTKRFYAKNNPYNIDVMSCPVHFIVDEDIEVTDIENYALKMQIPDFIILFHALGVSTWSSSLCDNMRPLTQDVMNIFEIHRSHIRFKGDEFKYELNIRYGLRFIVNESRVSLKSLLELLYTDRFITKRPKKLYNIVNDQYDILIL